MNTPNPLPLRALPRHAAKTYEPYWTLSITPIFGSYRIIISEYDSQNKCSGYWIHTIPVTELPNLPPPLALRDWIKTQVPEWNSQHAEARASASTSGTHSNLTLEDLGL